MGTAVKRVMAAVVGALLASSVVAMPAHAESATISGTITSEATAQPIEGCVHAFFTDSRTWAASDCTDGSGSGRWTIEGLHAGTSYAVQLESNDAHVYEWWQDAPGIEEATPVVAPATLDAALTMAATLAGTLTVADGDPLPADTTVTVHSMTGNDRFSTTPVDGNWHVNVPAGTYLVSFQVGATQRWAVGKATADAADPISARAGETTRVDDVLPAVDETTFSGTVTAADTGEPLDACVHAYAASDFQPAGWTCTGAESPGRWTMSQLAAGTAYKFEVTTWDGRHVNAWAPDASRFDSAASYVGPATINVALELGGTLTGVLLGADGQPQAGVSASIESVEGVGAASAVTAETGEWSALVPPGDYVVQFWSQEGRHQWATGKTSQESATIFHVGAGQAVDASDRFLPTGGVTGTIVSDVDGQPIAGACIDILDYPITEYPTGAGQACTDAEGRYSLALDREGTFTAQFSDPAGDGRHVTEYYGDAADAESAQPFTVMAGSPLQLDASLAPGATITGVATDAKLGTPVAGVCPEAYVGHAGSRVMGQFLSCSDEQGRWRVSGLRAGSYALNFVLGDNGAGAASQTWAFKADSQASADLVTVASGQSLPIRDVKVPSPASLTGRIIDPSGSPIEGAIVNPRGFLPDRSGECFDCAVTDADGRYTIPVLASGTYRPVAYAPWDVPLAPAWSGNSTSFDSATPITLNPGKTGTISLQLAPASRITVDVVEADGSPTEQPWLGEVVTTTGRHVADFDIWEGNVATTAALPAGSFLIRLENPLTMEVVWFDGATSLENATPIMLGVGENKQVTMHLR